MVVVRVLAVHGGRTDRLPGGAWRGSPRHILGYVLKELDHAQQLGIAAVVALKCVGHM